MPRKPHSEFATRARITRTYPIPNAKGQIAVATGHDSGIVVQWFPVKKPEQDGVYSQYDAFQYHTGCRVLDIAFPSFPPPSQRHTLRYPAGLESHLIVAAACSDCTVKLIALPFSPVSTNAQNKKTHGRLLGVLSHPDIPTSVSLSWTAPLISEAHPEDTMDMDISLVSSDQPVDLLIASCHQEQFATMFVTRISPVVPAEHEESSPSHLSPFQRVTLPTSPATVSISPMSYSSRENTRILVACSPGNVYVYGPFCYRDRETGLGMWPLLEPDPPKGTWLASFQTRFHGDSADKSSLDPIPHRKVILDAKWTLNGSAIVGLLEDGEWGVWDVDGAHHESNPTADPSMFALWGMIGSSVPYHIGKPLAKKPREPSSSLPTMTPNTRRTKAETLFNAIPHPITAAHRGGISVTPVPLPSSDNTEDLIAFWYGESICYIDSLEAYWNRATQRSMDAKLGTAGGSLFGPGLTRVDALNTNGQAIVAISELPKKWAEGSERTILLTAEYQLFCMPGSSSRKSLPSNALAHRPKGPIVKKAPPKPMIPSSGNLNFGMINNVIDSMDDGDVFMSGALIPTQ